MTRLLIESDHYMELNISYLTELARHKAASKIEITFPSAFLLETFMNNFCAELDREKIEAANIDLSVFVPKGD